MKFCVPTLLIWGLGGGMIKTETGSRNEPSAAAILNNVFYLYACSNFPEGIVAF